MLQKLKTVAHNHKTQVNCIRHKRIPGGALYFSIFIGLIVMVLCVILILNLQLNDKIITNEIKKEQLIHHVNSALNIYALEFSNYNYDQNYDFQIFEQDPIQIQLSKERWGVYDVIHIRSTWKNFSYQKTALAGEDLRPHEPVGLYLQDNNDYLSISGNTVLSGNCYLPRLGVRKAYIEGFGYSQSTLVQGSIKSSKGTLPIPDNQLTSYLDNMMKPVHNTHDSLVYYTPSHRSKDVVNAFSNKTLILYSEDDLVLRNQNFSGNIIIKSRRNIIIQDDNELDYAILIAKNILIEEGFEGRLQAFATDTLIVEEDCHLKFPSVIGTINSALHGNYLEFGENSVVSGGILVYKEIPNPIPPKIYLAEGSLVHGQVYCNGNVEPRGKIYGTLFCSKVELLTRKAYYVSHLLNTSIDYNALSENFVGFSLLESIQKRNLTWLN